CRPALQRQRQRFLSLSGAHFVEPAQGLLNQGRLAMISLGAVLDVAIGLALTYATVALIATAFQEVAARLMKKRAKDLEAGIKDLLTGKSTDNQAIKLFSDVFNHSAVKSISPGGKPSYLAAHNFSLALFDTLSGGSQSPLFSQIESNVAALPNDCPAKS